MHKHWEKALFEKLAGYTFEKFFIDLLPFVVTQSHDSFTLLSLKDVMLSQYCQQAITVLCTGY
jgi:hypothetical protein